MKIGIDIDGTITTPFYWLPLFNRLLNKNLSPHMIHHYDHHLDFQITREAFQALRKKHLYEAHELAQIRLGAAHYIKKISEDVTRIHIITARETCLEGLTKTWLKKHRVTYDELHLLGKVNKLEKVQDLGIQLMIEDRYETALALANEGIPVLLFTTSYNLGPFHHKIHRIDSWKQAYEFIYFYQDICTDYLQERI